MVEISKVSEDLSRSQAISELSSNDQILNGKINDKVLDKLEIDSLHTILGFSHKYLRQISLGHSAITYVNWTSYKSESGYDIWKYNVSNFADDTNNQMLMNDTLLEYMGEAGSEGISAFNKVLSVIDGVSTDVTSEASSEGGTSFVIISGVAVSDNYLYVGSVNVFNSTDFELEQIGSDYGLKMDYFDGSSWRAWDGSCDYSLFVDNTDNLHYSGRVSFDLPSCWTSTTVDGTCYYWVRFYTNDVPSISAYAYHILPGDSVVTLLSLSQLQTAHQDWAWCYFNNYVYVTLPNDGDSYFEGNLYIKASSNNVKKKNYFVYNQEFICSYLNSAYSGSGSFTFKFPSWTSATRPSSPEIGNAGWNTEYEQTEMWDGNNWRVIG